MKPFRQVLMSALFLMLCGTATAAVKTEVIEYKDGEVTCKGYLAYDDAVKGPRPAVLVVHEWWGLGEHAKRSARRLAEQGYVGFAVDMYGGGFLTDEMAEASARSSDMKKHPEKSQPRFVAALEALKKRPEVDAARVGAMGYCFGGTTVLDMARLGLDLRGVVSFHGGLATAVSNHNAEPKAAILVCHGADDPFISAEELAGFKTEMAARKAQLQFVAYPGAVHSFTNPEVDAHGISGAKYNKDADEASWSEMTAFFKQVLAK